MSRSAGASGLSGISGLFGLANTASGGGGIGYLSSGSSLLSAGRTIYDGFAGSFASELLALLPDWGK
ncbi:MAG: hypothetical protein IPI17_17835 [Nitrosomonas sp.]|nr:hypothetical protein [Nitrosomonas sp.]